MKQKNSTKTTLNEKKGLKNISRFFASSHTVMNYVKCCQNGTLKQLQDLSSAQWTILSKSTFHYETQKLFNLASQTRKCSIFWQNCSPCNVPPPRVDKKI